MPLTYAMLPTPCALMQLCAIVHALGSWFPDNKQGPVVSCTQGCIIVVAAAKRNGEVLVAHGSVVEKPG